MWCEHPRLYLWIFWGEVHVISLTQQAIGRDAPMETLATIVIRLAPSGHVASIDHGQQVLDLPFGVLDLQTEEHHGTAERMNERTNEWMKNFINVSVCSSAVAPIGGTKENACINNAYIWLPQYCITAIKSHFSIAIWLNSSHFLFWEPIDLAISLAQPDVMSWGWLQYWDIPLYENVSWAGGQVGRGKIAWQTGCGTISLSLLS